MQTLDQVIDNILLNSPYGQKAYEERQKRLREKELVKETHEDIIQDHLKQTFIEFEEDKDVTR